MSVERFPPYPEADVRAWMQKMYTYLSEQSPIRGTVDPAPILLSHVVANRMPRASTDGIVLYDPTLGQVVVSSGGLWKPLMWA